MSRLGHGLRMLALIVLLLACVFLPFLPGRYDPLAVTVSATAQFVGFAGLLLLPLAIPWSILEARRRKPREQPPVGTDKGYWLALACLCVSALVAGLATLAVIFGVGPALGVFSLSLTIILVRRMARALRRLKQPQVPRFNPAPLYLILVPVAVVGARFLLLEWAVESSRNRAIRNSTDLIAEIEVYHGARGHYPPSLAALHKDYSPGVIGVREYLYEPHGEGYSVFFEQFAVPLGTREVVMYNKLDEHALPSHDTDLLRWTPEELAARPGHYALHDAASAHWKYFWFD